jgi:hypothetical protein
MDERNRLNRLMSGLIRGGPPPADRMGAVLGKAAVIRRRRRAALLSGTAVGTVAVVAAGLLVLGPDHRTGRHDLLSDDPTATATAPPPPAPASPTATSTASAAPSASAAVPSGPSTAPGARPLTVATASLLSDDYLEQAFGGGQAADSTTLTDPLPGVVRSCYHVLLADQAPDRFVARTWAWPGEVAVAEVLAQEPTAEAAAARSASCTDPGSRDFDRDATYYPSDNGDPVVSHVDLQEHGTGTVVVLTWRETGTIGSADGFRRALQAAVRKAAGAAEGTPLAVPAVQVPDLLAGFLSHRALPHDTPWIHDALDDHDALQCGSTSVPTTEAPVARQWARTSNGEPETNLSVEVRVGRAADASTAGAGLAACRQGYVDAGQPVSSSSPTAPGDESFLVTPAPDLQVLVVRSGSTYLEVTCAAQQYEDLEKVARDSLAALSAAGRL